MKLTQWFPGDVKPVHVGVYERLTIERDEARRTVREAHEAGTRLTAQRDALLEALRYWLPDETMIPAGHEAKWNEAVAAIKVVEGEKE